MAEIFLPELALCLDHPTIVVLGRVGFLILAPLSVCGILGLSGWQRRRRRKRDRSHFEYLRRTANRARDTVGLRRTRPQALRCLRSRPPMIVSPGPELGVPQKVDSGEPQGVVLDTL
jgi:hypothetical protein